MAMYNTEARQETQQYVEEHARVLGRFWPEELYAQTFDTVISYGRIALDIEDDKAAGVYQDQPEIGATFSRISRVALNIGTLLMRKMPHAEFSRFERQLRTQNRKHHERLGKQAEIDGKQAEIDSIWKRHESAKQWHYQRLRRLASRELNKVDREERRDTKAAAKQALRETRLWRAMEYIFENNQQKLWELPQQEPSDGTLVANHEPIKKDHKPDFWPPGQPERPPHRSGMLVDWAVSVYKTFPGRVFNSQDFTKVLYAEDYDEDKDYALISKARAVLRSARIDANLAESGLMPVRFFGQSMKNAHRVHYYVALPIGSTSIPACADEGLRLTDDELRHTAIRLRGEERVLQANAKDLVYNRPKNQQPEPIVPYVVVLDANGFPPGFIKRIEKLEEELRTPPPEEEIRRLFNERGGYGIV